ncbi:MAG: hypothetical protein IJ773_01000 [Lachnospiraceae bacterium]|nr:hypothetical protein [Lachnospiraceae bacterium]
MADKKNKQTLSPEEQKTAAGYYELKSEAVKDLVEANEENSPKVSKEELKKYKSGPKFELSHGLKIILMKAWFYGAVCFFILWGLGIYITDLYDMLFVVGIVMGMVTDLLINSILRYFAQTEGANDDWMMFPSRSLVSFFANIFYCFLILYFVYSLYNMINAAIITVFGLTDQLPLGVGPILFGLFSMGFDQMFIAIKHLMIRIVDDATASVKGGEGKKTK